MSESFGYVRSSVVTDSGLVRETNEDAFVSLPEAGLFAVADGMGGGDDGEVASRWVADEIEGALDGSQAELPGVRLMALDDAVNRANRRIAGEAKSKGYAQMGSTVAALLLDPWQAAAPVVAHVGDSRVYRLRGGSLTRLTTDHTVGCELAQQNADTALADVRISRLAHVLTRTIGAADRVSVEWNATDLAAGDRFLLCTDGITTLLDDARIRDLLAGAASPRDACKVLAENVRAAGAVDNFTAIVIFAGGPLPPFVPHGPEDEEENDYLMRRFLI